MTAERYCPLWPSVAPGQRRGEPSKIGYTAIWKKDDIFTLVYSVER